MEIKIGHARYDENRKLKNGMSGDNTEKEVCIQNFYMHTKGWYVFRLKNVSHANKLAQAMIDACENDKIGYDQNNRNSVITALKKYGSLKAIAVNVEADCSSLVRACIIQATGKDLGAFRTKNQATVLEKSGLFERKSEVKSSGDVFVGDILVTKTKGHTAIVTSAPARTMGNSDRKIVALDAGHGINTAGKRTPDGIREWTLNDKVRDKVVERLKEYPIDFIFPDNDEGKRDESLISRRTMYVTKKVDAAVSIHHNAFKGVWGTASGVETYVDAKPTKADLELARCIHTRMVNNLGLKDRGIKKADFTVIKQNKIPAVLTEGGFMDNKKDYAIITSDAGQEAYARAIAEGLIEFLELKKVNVAEKFKPYTIKVTVNTLYVRKGAGTKNKVVGAITTKDNLIKKNPDYYFRNVPYTIVEEQTVGGHKWGKLKSGAGWISLQYTKRV